MRGSIAGVAAVGASALLLIWLVAQKLATPDYVDVQGWTSLMVAVTFFGGLIACLVGVALEYISTLVLTSQGKPTFFVVDRSRDDVPRRFFLNSEDTDAVGAAQERRS